MKFWILALGVVCASLSFAQQSEQPAEKPPAAAQPQTAGQNAAAEPAVAVTNAERTAIVITAWNLDVHLNTRQQTMEAQARVTLRNGGDSPLNRIALQLSSTLNFELIGFRGKKIGFTQGTLASDADHTGQLHEAVIPLAEPLAPQASLTLEVDYGGTVTLSAKRLTAIGAPDATAQGSDWDRISEDFTGLRGFGNVVWYPVSSLPVALGDGSKFFAEIGRQKLLDQDATASLRVTDEFSSVPPNAAILNGHFVNVDKPTAMPTASFPGVVTASVPATRLGFETPSLFLARRTEVDGNGLRVLALDPDVESAAEIYCRGGAGTAAGADVARRPARRPLGDKPQRSSTILDLPEPEDAPAEMGGLLATPLLTDEPAQLTPVVVHALAHGSFSSPRAWLNEGVASFLGTLWIESNQGHTAAVENLNAGREALALAEPGTPGQGGGEDLIGATSPVYYRTKAAYVLWMLREIAGEKPLDKALQTYDAAQDTKPEYFEHLLEQSSETDLKWFFDDWVYNDHGLPDLSIGGVYPSREARQQVVVAIEIVNEGYAEVEVPVTVKGVDASLTEHVRVPAHGRITHRITFQEDPTEVDLNDGTVPEVQDSIHRKLITQP